MNNKAKKYLLGTVISIALMFAWIFLTVLLTGGREIEDFTALDTYIFTGFIITEIITMICCFYFAFMLGRAKRQNVFSPPLEQPVMDKTQSKRANILAVCAFIVALGLMIAGIIFLGNATNGLRKVLETIFSVCFIMPIFLLIINLILKKRFVKSIEQKKIGEMQQYISSHREFAEKASEKKLLESNTIKLFTDLYTVLLLIFATGVALLAGILFETDFSVPFCLYSAFLFLSCFSRIRFAPSQTVFEEDKTYVSVKDYPEIYKTIIKAQNALDCKGEIKFSLIPDCNAGIAKIGNIYSVQVGVALLNMLSQEELYNIFLHEFAHVKNNAGQLTKTGAYNNWLTTGGNPHYLSNLSELLFCYFDTLFTFQFGLYLYASSITSETVADKAMAVYGNAEYAASSLLKLKYFELFGWEQENRDENSQFEEEEPDKLYITKQINRFKAAIDLRSNAWNKLAEGEILSRIASHPTLKMRLETLGITSLQAVFLPDSKEYTEECEKALGYVEKLVYDERVKDYKEYRNTYYLEPKAKIEAWETAEMPVIAEEYADIYTALRQLGRATDAYKLCEKAISELSPTAAGFAYFVNGAYMLHSYDDKGIEYIYKAIELNPNYIENGLDIIGDYCCLTGNEEQLTIYRERAVELCQQDKDKYSLVNILNKNDRLSSEQLPQELFESIMKYILSVDSDQCIDKVYLVRKQITDDFSTSVFVVKFTASTEENVKGEILYKIYRHLDTCSEHQFSLFNYDAVSDVKIEAIENSCVYSKKS